MDLSAILGIGGTVVGLILGLTAIWQAIRHVDCKWIERQGIKCDQPSFLSRVRGGDRQLEVIRRFLRSGMHPDVPGPAGETALVLAVVHGQVETVRLLLCRRLIGRSADPNLTGQHDLSPLAAAKLVGRKDIVEVLVGADARPESARGAGLLLAVQQGELETVRRALEAEGAAGVDARGLEGDTAAIEIARRPEGNPEILKLLLSSGADPNARGRGGRTALMGAAESANVGCAQVLLDHLQTQVNLEDQTGDTALDLARRRPRSQPVARLLEDRGGVARTVAADQQQALLGRLLAGAAAGDPNAAERLRQLVGQPNFDLNARTAEGRTLTGAAAATDQAELVEDLIQRGADPDAPDAEGRSALQVAVGEKAVRSARVLLDRGASVDLEDPAGDTPLHVASREGSLELVEELLRHQASVDAADRAGGSPLQAAVERGQLAVVRRLIAAGADVDRSDRYGQTPLMVAILEGFTEVADELRLAGAKRGEAEARLILAAERGDAAEVESLLAAGADVRATTRGGRSALLEAARLGRLEVVRKLLVTPSGCRPDLEQADDRSRTALMRAVRNYHLEVARALLAAGADPDTRRGDGSTALHDASQRGRLDLVDALLGAGARVDAELRDGRTPLILAVENGHADVARRLIFGGADVDAASRYGESPLMLALLRGDREMAELLRGHGASRGEAEAELYLAASRGDARRVRELLAAGVPADARTYRGKPPLLAAVEHGHLAAAEALVEAGANVNDRSWRRTPAIVRAAAGGHQRLVGMLLAKGASPNLEGPGGGTPLMAACSRGHVGTARALLGAGADPNARDLHSRSPLMISILEDHAGLMRLLRDYGASAGRAEAGLILAAERGEPAQVQAFIDQGADVDALGTRRRTALIGACQRGNAAIVATLLDAGADPNLAGTAGRTSLTVAARLGPMEVVEALLAAGASPDLPGESDRTPLAAAADAGRIEVVGRLLAADANPNLKDRDGHTALSLAAQRGHLPVLDDLLAADAAVEARSGGGRTALHAASEGGQAEAVTKLLAAGADLEARDANGATALILASLAGREGVVEALLAAGADFDVQDSMGNTPLMAAILEERRDVERRLRGAGATEGEREAELLRSARVGDLRRVRELVAKGANVNARCLGDDSALLLAVCTPDGGSDEDHRGAAFDLLAAGAAVQVKGRGGRTALVCAARQGDGELVEALLERGACRVVEAVEAGPPLATAATLAAAAGHRAVVDLLADRCGALRPTDAVFLTEYGDRYHRRTCAFIRPGAAARPLAEALAAGRRPCTRCFEAQ